MRSIAGSVLVVTLLTLAGQVLAFATQMMMAAFFGAGAGMDAFLAANAIPQYVIAVVLGSLSVVFVPVFIEYLKTGREDEAWLVASSIINLTLLGLGVLVIAGVLFPEVILGATAPGLIKGVRLQAVQVAVITWPSVLATGVISLLTGIYQSQARFGWPAAVPVIGAFVNLSMIFILTQRFGIIGLAIANTVGILLQAGLLLPLAFKRGCYRLTLNWRHPGVGKVLRLLLPLVIANVVAKSIPVIDRFFASKMEEGSISHLGYAFRIFSVLSVLISTGIATVVFPRMATNVASTEISNLRRTISGSMRVMWLAIAPVMAISRALALPLIMVLFRRGQFSLDDAIVVSGLMQIYLLALPAACLATVTGRSFYELKDTRTVAILGSLESLAYVLYAWVLSQRFGVMGVAFAFVLYFNISLLWQALVMRYKVGQVGGRTVINSFVRTGLAAILGGAAAWSVTVLMPNVWLQLVLGAVSGLSVYFLGLWFLQTSEIDLMWKSLLE